MITVYELILIFFVSFAKIRRVFYISKYLAPFFYFRVISQIIFSEKIRILRILADFFIPLQKNLEEYATNPL